MNRVLKISIILLCVILVISLAIYFIGKTEKGKKVDEYEPEEEISLDQERKTLVSLYFVNKISKELQAEGRLIDVKDLVKEPYITLLKLLIEDPKNENLERIFPENVKINSVKLEGDILIIDLSNDFTNVTGEENEKNLIDSIVKTLTELTEVNGIKILIEGEENKAFSDNIISFKENFVRE